MASMKSAFERLSEEMVEAFKCAGRDGQEKISVMLCAATQPNAPQLRKRLYQALADVGVNLNVAPYREEQAAVTQKRKEAGVRTSAAMKKATGVAEEARRLLDATSELATSNLIVTEPGTPAVPAINRAPSPVALSTPINTTAFHPNNAPDQPRPHQGPRIMK